MTYSSEPIIPGVTDCPDNCKLVEIIGDSTLEVDGDCITYGRPMMCPVHQDCIIYVFGSDWWGAWGGSNGYGENRTPGVVLWCPECSKHYRVTAWSYGG